MAAKGLLLHNLTNIRRSADTWQGSATTQDDPDFVTFLADKYSIRATARLLILYQDRLGKGTITLQEILSRWAPSSENNTSAYVDNVCTWTGFLPMHEVDITTFDPASKIIQAMIRMEVGLINYDMTVITEGLKLAGIVAPLPAVTKTPALTIPAITAVLVAATPVLQSAQSLVSSASPFAAVLTPIASAAPYLIGILVVAAAVYLITHELNKRKVAA